MIRKLVLLLMIIMGMLLAFFCTKNHKESIIAKLIPQNKKMDILKIENKIDKPIKHSVHIIESVTHIKPVVIIRVDESEPAKPKIKRMTTEELLEDNKPKKSENIVKLPTPIIVMEKKTLPISKKYHAPIQKTSESFEELEKQMLEEMSKKSPTPTPTPTNNISKDIDKSIVKKNKNIKNNDMSEIEKQMLEEIKNFK